MSLQFATETGTVTRLVSFLPLWVLLFLRLPLPTTLTMVFLPLPLPPELRAATTNRAAILLVGVRGVIASRLVVAFWEALGCIVGANS